jgi:uncharacterized protein VirK/YbjX
MKRLLQVVSHTRPGVPSIGYRRKLAHFLRCAAHIETFQDWFGNPSNPALQEALVMRPSIVTCVVHPYIHVDWSAERKLQVIGLHYRLLTGRLAFLRFAPTTSIRLAEVDEAVQVRLEKPEIFEHEGELTINLFRNDTRLFSLTFTLEQSGPHIIAYVGGLQGAAGSDSLEIYRTLTHRMQGLRPRDLLVTAFRLLCGSLGVARILAVSDQRRICSSSYFESSVQVHCSYDSAWIDSGGVAVEGGFYALPRDIAQRPFESIPSRKRAQYRRRYAMIDDLAAQIDSSVRQAHRPRTLVPVHDRSGS